MPSDSDQDKIANLLLLSLSDHSMRRLKPHWEFRAFSRGQVSNREGRPVQEYHFVNRGLISLVKTMNDGRAVEIGIVGIEGLTTAHTLFSLNRVAIDTVVQIPGNSFVIRRDALLNAMSGDGGLRRLYKIMRISHTALLHKQLLAIAFTISRSLVVAGYSLLTITQEQTPFRLPMNF